MTPRSLVSGTTEPRWVQVLLIGGVLVFMGLFLLLPLLTVLAEALAQGGHAYMQALHEPDAWSAIQLTLIIAAITVPIDRKSTRLNSSHMSESRMPSSA